MKIFLAFFLQNIYFSYLCSDFLMDIKMKQTPNIAFFTPCQCNVDLSGVGIIYNNERAREGCRCFYVSGE